MTFDSQAGERFTLTVRKNYSIAEVDAFVVRVENALRHAYMGAGTALTVSAAEVRHASFGSTKPLQKGYDRDEVDAFLHEAAQQLEELTSKRRGVAEQSSAALPQPTLAEPRQPTPAEGSQQPTSDWQQAPSNVHPPTPPQVRPQPAGPPQANDPAAAELFEPALPATEGPSRSEPAVTPAYRRLPPEITAPAQRPRSERFEHAGRLTMGYAVDEVDAFVDQVAAGVQWPGGEPIRAEHAREVRFTTKRNGYDEREVDAWLDTFEAALS